jgi:hypothetical protein
MQSRGADAATPRGCSRTVNAETGFISPVAVLIAVASLLACVGGARAQDMEPRVYSASPIGTNFLNTSYLRTTGSVSLDPSLPLTDVKASINAGTLAYDRTFDLFGQMASAAIVLPYIHGDVSGNVFEQSSQVSRSGLGDLGLRFSANIFGNPALTAEEFAQREPTTTFGASLSVVAPTGDYNPRHLINIDSNRWAFKPEIGLSQPIGNWFADASASVSVFTDNPNFFGGHVSGQDPIGAFQLHAGYNFRPGLWLAVDGTHYAGGNTSLDGVVGHEFQVVSRYGLTLSAPIVEDFSTKFAWSTWLTAHNGGGFQKIVVTLQSRWFD